MDGVHDMGGMDGFGKVEVEKNEPVFHASWEGAYSPCSEPWHMPVPGKSTIRASRRNSYRQLLI